MGITTATHASDVGVNAMRGADGSSNVSSRVMTPNSETKNLANGLRNKTFSSATPGSTTEIAGSPDRSQLAVTKSALIAATAKSSFVWLSQRTIKIMSLHSAKRPDIVTLKAAFAATCLSLIPQMVQRLPAFACLSSENVDCKPSQT
jgi:hypothetical protein